jgi:hypothetical protein
MEAMEVGRQPRKNGLAVPGTATSVLLLILAATSAFASTHATTNPPPAFAEQADLNAPLSLPEPRTMADATATWSFYVIVLTPLVYLVARRFFLRQKPKAKARRTRKKRR